MNEIDTTPSYLHDRNYLDLVAYYVEHPIALYTGSGVSWSDDPDFGVGLWDDFLEKILTSDKSVTPEMTKEFEKKLVEWKDKPWEIAGWVAEKNWE